MLRSMQTTYSRSLDLLNKIIEDFSDRFNFKEGQIFSWSSADSTIIYSTSKSAAENGVWSLLHEIGHAELNHKQYNDDLELLIMEVEAWKQAKEIAKKYYLVIDDEHIQECLDSYRDWLHLRSSCVECRANSFQIDATTYECYNCSTKWKVPSSRMCVVRKRRLT